MNFQEIEKLFDDKGVDAVLITRTPRTLSLHEFDSQKLLNVTGIGLKACSLTDNKIHITEQGTAFSTDANGSPVEPS